MENENGRFEIVRILETVAIIFKDGEKELHDAIQLFAKKGIITGNIIDLDKSNRKKIRNNHKHLVNKDDFNFSKIFIERGYIPINNIDHIESVSERKILKKIF